MIFWVHSWVKGQKKVQNDKKLCPLHSISEVPYIMWLSFMVHMCFFSFFQILIFPVVIGVKGQKMVQNDKKFCPSRFRSQEPYIIWLSFMTHLCKIIISLGIFSIFSKFWFFGLLGGWGVKGQKMVQNNKKFCQSCSIFQEPYIYDCHFWYTCVK